MGGTRPLSSPRRQTFCEPPHIPHRCCEPPLHNTKATTRLKSIQIKTTQTSPELGRLRSRCGRTCTPLLVSKQDCFFSRSPLSYCCCWSTTLTSNIKHPACTPFRIGPAGTIPSHQLHSHFSAFPTRSPRSIFLAARAPSSAEIPVSPAPQPAPSPG